MKRGVHLNVGCCFGFIHVASAHGMACLACDTAMYAGWPSSLYTACISHTVRCISSSQELFCSLHYAWLQASGGGATGPVRDTAILVSGPHGCGKTAAVFACAQVGWLGGAACPVCGWALWVWSSGVCICGWFRWGQRGLQSYACAQVGEQHLGWQRML